ncbi:SUF system NifU family Fe-S cluster assembly protein [Paenarthrobacter sp. DKR-5]|uniref:Fe-S cluster assembly sulfur transfer protein SufU n=1 Tax=Paenarthrobacter sp. DKR-5 TaxID=2835535 RepID=UPI001BDD24AD|nr:SUF system NifU family Fe-S cluster assembly protein [Paenarthrobacter sp. DKR-5]MBT1002481.1 SUF system NifU family Fe-S cluster assembly protein [Paenarthrobacter sp. DKR-5]
MSGLDALYQQIILDHSKARHGSGLDTPAPAGAEAVSHQLNPVCGDEITLRAVVEGGRIRQLRWDGAGCAISMASASVLSDLAEGMELAEFGVLAGAFREMMRSRGKIEPDEEVLAEAAAFAGVSRYAARVKCAMLAWVAAEDAVGRASGGASG